MVKNNERDLEKRTFDFAINVIELLELLPENRRTGVVIYQLAKSGTSIGANYEETQASHSKDDFYYRIGICLRESRESNFWLRIIDAKKWVPNNQLLRSLVRESEEFKKIFGKIYSKRNRQ